MLVPECPNMCFHCMQVASNSSQHVELMLQESCTDQSGSLVVYSTFDVDAIQLAMSGEDPSCIPLLPLGFVIVPVEPTSDTTTTTNGTDGSSVPSSEDCTGHAASSTAGSSCLLTVGLQILASTIPSAKLNLSSVTAINNHLCNTVQQIIGALGNNSSTCTDNASVGGSCTDPNSSAAPKQ